MSTVIMFVILIIFPYIGGGYLIYLAGINGYIFKMSCFSIVLISYSFSLRYVYNNIDRTKKEE